MSSPRSVGGSFRLALAESQCVLTHGAERTWEEIAFGTARITRIPEGAAPFPMIALTTGRT